MKQVLDACWRASVYCLHPRVIALSVLPLVLMVVAALGLGYFFWDAAIDAVNAQLDRWSMVQEAYGLLERFGKPELKSALAPLIVVFLATPAIAIVALLCVAALMTPAMLSLVAERRFPRLERKHGGSIIGSMFGALGATLLALLALLVSIPLWFVPPLVLVIPPLIWGWLTYRVFLYDVLADHASRAERREIVQRHRLPLLVMGILAGLLGAAPSLVWASGVLFVALAPVLVPVAIWIYTLVFAFASLWFAHYALAALQQLRAEAAPPAATPAAALPPQPAIDLLPPP